CQHRIDRPFPGSALDSDILFRYSARELARLQVEILRAFKMRRSPGVALRRPKAVGISEDSRRGWSKSSSRPGQRAARAAVAPGDEPLGHASSGRAMVKPR